MRGRVHCILLASLAAMSLLLAFGISASAQQLAKRLILKDGSYQLATKYEIKGERVRLLQRRAWGMGGSSQIHGGLGMPPTNTKRIVPVVHLLRKLWNSIGNSRPSVKLKKPKPLRLAPGLRLSEYSSVVLLDTYQGQPQLVEIDQELVARSMQQERQYLTGCIQPLAGCQADD